MNKKTFNLQESKAYHTIPIKNRKTYRCIWEVDNEYDEEVTIKATDEKMLARFIDAEYTKRPDVVFQVITQYKPVDLTNL
jgi:hypothetical protein